MTHEGRMTRGKENVEKNILLDNEDTKYYLANSKEEKEEAQIKKPSKKKEKVEDGDN